MTVVAELLTVIFSCPQWLDKTINFCFLFIFFYKFIHSLCCNWSDVVFRNTSIIYEFYFGFLSMPIDNQLLRAKVRIYNFRRSFIKHKFVISHAINELLLQYYLRLACLYYYITALHIYFLFFKRVSSYLWNQSNHVLLTVLIFLFTYFFCYYLLEDTFIKFSWYWNNPRS